MGTVPPVPELRSSLTDLSSPRLASLATDHGGRSTSAFGGRHIDVPQDRNGGQGVHEPHHRTNPPRRRSSCPRTARVGPLPATCSAWRVHSLFRPTPVRPGYPFAPPGGGCS